MLIFPAKKIGNIVMNTPANKRPGVAKDTHSGLIDLNTTSAPRNAEIAPEAPTVTTGVRIVAHAISVWYVIMLLNSPPNK